MSLSQTTEQINLPGHLKSESEALKGSSVAAVITFVSKGVTDDGPPMVMFCNHNEIKVEEALMGNVSGTLDCMFSYSVFPDSKRESLPVIGSRYIVFLRPGVVHIGEAAYVAIRFSAYSKEEVGHVKDLVSKSKLSTKQE